MEVAVLQEGLHGSDDLPEISVVHVLKGSPENNVVTLVPCLPVNRREKWIRCSLISPLLPRDVPKLNVDQRPCRFSK